MDVVLGEMFVSEMVEQVWNLRTANCGVSVFETASATRAQPGGPGLGLR